MLFLKSHGLFTATSVRVCLQLHSCGFDFPPKLGAWMCVISVLFLEVMQSLFQLNFFLLYD